MSRNSESTLELRSDTCFQCSGSGPVHFEAATAAVFLITSRSCPSPSCSSRAIRARSSSCTAMSCREKAACSNLARRCTRSRQNSRVRSTMPLARFQGKWTVKTVWPRLQTQPAPFKTPTRKSRLARGDNEFALPSAIHYVFFVVRYKAVIGHR